MFEPRPPGALAPPSCVAIASGCSSCFAIWHSNSLILMGFSPLRSSKPGHACCYTCRRRLYARVGRSANVAHGVLKVGYNHSMQVEAGPELLRNWIAAAARRDPDKAWVVCADDGRTVTYGELRELTGRIAAVLPRGGIRANDRVALLSNNSIEHLIVYLGTLAYGATVCTVHVEMNRPQLGDIFGRLKPQLVLHQDGLGLDDLLSTTAAPRQRLGQWDKAS